MTISEKVAYIKGLSDGLNIDKDSNEGKLFAQILEVLDDIAAEIEEVEDTVCEMQEQVDAIDEDLGEVEDYLCDDEDDCCCCDDCDDDDELYEVECPNCHDVIYVDDEMLEDKGITCPNCGTDLEFDFDCDCDCCKEESKDEE